MIDPGDILRSVNVTAACVNALAILAAPIVLMRCRKEAEKNGGTLDLLPHLDALIEIVEGMSPSRKSHSDGPQLVALADAARAIREAIAAKPDPRNNVDRAIIEAARAALAAYGLAPPPEGWDKHTIDSWRRVGRLRRPGTR